MYSVAYITRPRTKKANACLCFTLMSGMPKKKPWKRDPDARDPSRSVVVDLQEFSEWQMDSTVKMALFDPPVAQPSDAERQLLTAEGILPFESSALGKRCVMCPVKHGSPQLIWRCAPVICWICGTLSIEHLLYVRFLTMAVRNRVYPEFDVPIPICTKICHYSVSFSDLKP